MFRHTPALDKLNYRPDSLTGKGHLGMLFVDVMNDFVAHGYRPTMRIAVIGGGVSGLSAAYWLGSDHDVTLFEANDYAGGHTQTLAVEHEGQRHAIDVGFIVFNDRTYPNFIRLLDELGVQSRPTTMSFSVRDDRAGLEYNGHSLASLFAQRRNLLRPSFYRMLADIGRFNSEAPRAVAECDGETTVGDFLARQNYSRHFVEQYLTPMGAAIWSCPTGAFAHFPIHFVVEFFQNHGLLSVRGRPTWRVIKGGSRTYVDAILRSFPGRVRLQTPVAAVRRLADRVEVQPRGGNPEAFDHVVVACHADQALRILGAEATAVERETLSAFPYSRNTAVLHTDASVLPRRRRAWASWNYRLSGDESAPPTVTYNMNLLQGLQSQNTFCVTLNDESSVAPQRILRRMEYHHPVFTTQRTAAQARHAELLGPHRTSFCGAYWGAGFHEDGVNSALAVVRAIRRLPASLHGDLPAPHSLAHRTRTDPEPAEVGGGSS